MDGIMLKRIYSCENQNFAVKNISMIQWFWVWSCVGKFQDMIFIIFLNIFKGDGIWTNRRLIVNEIASTWTNEKQCAGKEPCMHLHFSHPTIWMKLLALQLRPGRGFNTFIRWSQIVGIHCSFLRIVVPCVYCAGWIEATFHDDVFLIGNNMSSILVSANRCWLLWVFLVGTEV